MKVFRRIEAQRRAEPEGVTRHVRKTVCYTQHDGPSVTDDENRIAISAGATVVLPISGSFVTESPTPSSPVPFRVGCWLPSDQAFLERWLTAAIERARADPGELHPVVAEFRNLIEADAQVFMLFHQMFEQIPHKHPFNKDPTGRPQVRDYHHLLELMNMIMTQAPEYNTSRLVGCPINALLDWSMGTAAGFAAFLDQRVNAHRKRILNERCWFWNSAQSTYVLNDDPHKGWFGAAARKAMPNFDQEFHCDLALPHHGFKSWGNFFTCGFRPGVEPVSRAEDSSIIVNRLHHVGQHVKKGDQIGMFHFGGSTDCLIFRPEVTLEFDHHGQTPGLHSSNIPLNARIAPVLG